MRRREERGQDKRGWWDQSQTKNEENNERADSVEPSLDSLVHIA